VNASFGELYLQSEVAMNAALILPDTCYIL